jgi:hypothetical protein
MKQIYAIIETREPDMDFYDSEHIRYLSVRLAAAEKVFWMLVKESDSKYHQFYLVSIPLGELLHGDVHNYATILI